MNLSRFCLFLRTDTLPFCTLSLLGLGLSLAVSGCRHQSVTLTSTLPSAKPITAPVKHPVLPKISPAELLTQFHVNEAGVVPILEYHTFGESESVMDRSPKAFRHDLERLWREGYCPVSLHEYLDNRIDLPLGKSPVIFTFDDSRESQLSLLDDGTIDPACAVGIMQTFHAAHPDFALKATFYVIPHAMFGPASQTAQKLRLLQELGFEIGNHTLTHPTLSKLSDANVQKEFAGCLTLTRNFDPTVTMDTVALPKGVFPRNRSLLALGHDHAQKYAHRAVLLGGYCPAQSPVSPRYDPMRLPRVVAHEGHMGITYWLDTLKQHPERRYVSDGDTKTLTIPKTAASRVDTRKLREAKLRVY